MAALNDPATRAEVERLMKDPNFMAKMQNLKADPNFQQALKQTGELLQDPRKREALTQDLKAAAAQARYAFFDPIHYFFLYVTSRLALMKVSSFYRTHP